LRANISGYQAIYGAEALNAAFSANTIGQDILTQLNLSAQSQATTSTDPLAAISDGLSLMGAIPEAGTAFSFLSSAVQMTELLAKSGDQPVPSLPNQVTLTAANAGSTIAATYQQASDGMGVNGDYMVQDPQKLITAAYDMFKGQRALGQPGGAGQCAVRRPRAHHRPRGRAAEDRRRRHAPVPLGRDPRHELRQLDR
jgi:hypothetical protein